MQQRNVVEILDMKVRNLKKKNDMILSENENLRTELKLLCAADQDVQNDFTNTEIARLQRKIKTLKDLNQGLELQINSLQAENRLKSSPTKGVKIFEDNVLGKEGPQYQLLQAIDRIKELENEKNNDFEKQTNLKEFAMRVHHLEYENEKLREALQSNFNFIFELWI